MGALTGSKLLALTALLACACGATVMSREAEHEEGDPTGIERLEREAEDTEISEHSAPAPEEDNSEFAVEQQEMQEKPEKPERKEQEHAVSAKDQSVWSSGSAETVLERARRQLKRRCDSGSKAACSAIPDIDRCGNRQPRSCEKLGELYAKGASGVARDPEHARDFWLKACDLAPPDCVQYGRALFDMDGLEQREDIAEHLFNMGCTQEYGLCADIARFYEEKKQTEMARKYFDLACAGGQTAACRDKSGSAAR